MRIVKSIRLVVSALVMVPSVVFAQASITGVVKDTSSGVLPGVTVEASSPALIERTRSVVTDGTGQYRIVDLRPGTYDVTFTLAGFNTLKREGIELTGSFVASVNVELRVGTVTETVTVTGESPLVDVQSTTRQRSMTHEVIDAVPSGRLPTELAVLIPGVVTVGSVAFNGQGAQDVGGSGGDQVVTVGIHGSKGDSSKITQNGVATNMNLGNWNLITPNIGGAQEVSVNTSGISAESSEGGVQMNIIPREGGNAFRGTFFGSFANNGMASNNLTDDLRARGLTAINSVKKVVDLNPGIGGPVMKDRLWFYGTYHFNEADNWASGTGVDPNANNPKSFVNPYSNLANLKPVSNDGTWKEGQIRLTFQATPKHKFGFSEIAERQCKCPSYNSATRSPGINNIWGKPHHVETLDWSSPLTSRVLVEANLFHQYSRWGWFVLDGTDPDIIVIQEQSNGTLFHGGWLSDFDDHWTADLRYRAALSYVTGAHSFKLGFNNGTSNNDTLFIPAGVNQPVSYRFNNGVPNQITEYALPYHQLWDVDADAGAFAQDRWTLKRLTINAGVRWDHYKSTNVGQHLGPAKLVPNRDLTLQDTTDLRWNDITPRFGAAFDLARDGKTAIKASLSKYVAGRTGPFAPPIGQNGGGTIANTASRSWNDRAGLGINDDFTPQCDLVNPAANGECGPLAPSNFGSPIPATTYDPAVRDGWGSRGYNWEFSTGVQRQVVPGVSIDVSYFRRIFANFLVTDNIAVPSTAFDPFSIVAPADAALPGGGGHLITGLYNVNPAFFSVPTNNVVHFSDTYGNQYEHWNGVDITGNARLSHGLLLQGGLSAGRTSTDNCEIAAKVPEALIAGSTVTPLQYCHVDTNVLSQIKALASYTIPRIDVLVSGTLQSIPGPAIAANFNASNAAVQPWLGRPLSGGAANVAVNLIAPGTLYGDRLNQLDVRFGKILKAGRQRANVHVDLYNVLNSSAVQQLSNTYPGTAAIPWQAPQVLLIGRFAKIGVQYDF